MRVSWVVECAMFILPREPTLVTHSSVTPAFRGGTTTSALLGGPGLCAI